MIGDNGLEIRARVWRYELILWRCAVGFVPESASSETGLCGSTEKTATGHPGGSLRFFKNGVEHGPGYPAGSVTGPVARAVQMHYKNSEARLLRDAAWPAGHEEGHEEREARRHG